MQCLAVLVCAIFMLVLQCKAQDQCITEIYGEPTDSSHDLPVMILKPGQAMWEITIPPVCPDQVGEQVTACDYEVRPSLKISSLDTFTVKRLGSIDQPTQVYVKVFCVASPDVAAL